MNFRDIADLFILPMNAAQSVANKIITVSTQLTAIVGHTSSRITRGSVRRLQRYSELLRKAAINVIMTLLKLADFVFDNALYLATLASYVVAFGVKQILGETVAKLIGSTLIIGFVADSSVSLFISAASFALASPLFPIILPFSGYLTAFVGYVAYKYARLSLDIFNAMMDSDYFMLRPVDIDRPMQERSSVLQDIFARIIGYERPEVRLGHGVQNRNNNPDNQSSRFVNPVPRHVQTLGYVAQSPEALQAGMGGLLELTDQEIEIQQRNRELALRRNEVAAQVLNNIREVAPANNVRLIVPENVRQLIDRFDAAIDNCLRQNNFAPQRQTILDLKRLYFLQHPDRYEQILLLDLNDDINIISGFELLRRESRYSPGRDVGILDPNLLDAEIQEEWRCVITGECMSIPVYLEHQQNGRTYRTYMDLLSAMSTYARTAREYYDRGVHPTTREAFTLANLKYDADMHRDINALKDRLSNPPLPIQQNVINLNYNTFDGAIDTAVATGDISHVFNYLRREGGAPAHGWLLNFTAELQAEIANSRYQSINYWAGKLTPEQRAAIVEGNPELLCYSSHELLILPLRIGPEQGNTISLLQFLGYMIYRHRNENYLNDINPRTLQMIRSLDEITFDAGKMQTIANLVQHPEQIVGVNPPRPGQPATENRGYFAQFNVGVRGYLPQPLQNMLGVVPELPIQPLTSTIQPDF